MKIKDAIEQARIAVEKNLARERCIKRIYDDTETEQWLGNWTLDEVPESFRDQVWLEYDEPGGEVIEQFFVNTQTGCVLTSYGRHLKGGLPRLKKIAEQSHNTQN
ncbi:MAG: hypothetical protein DDT23_00884 [candidate division WS2 bacterium]|nr:hypothetical protein [Candidatus Lithacetigena glycinireducens]